MDVADQLESYFGAAAAERLGREVGLSAADAARVVREGLALQIGALAAHARTETGRTQLREAVENLPVFPGVEAVLDEPGAGANLQQAGELLGPVLLGAQVGPGVTADLDPGRVQKLLQVLLPLLLSFLGQRGLTSADAPRLLSDLHASLEGPVGLAGGALTAAALTEFLKGQFQGAAADRLGRAAGFTGSTASRAAQAALPVILGGLAGRASTGAGAADLLTRMRETERLVGADGQLNMALLGDQAEVARIEGQGRGLLGALFPNLDALTGRFGSATSGSGSSAGRLLALMTPLVFGLVGGRARTANLDAAGLSAVLGGVPDRLPGLLPPGLSSLNALLKPAPAATPAVSPIAETTRVQTVATSVPSITTTPPAPRPAIKTPPPPAPAPAQVTTTTTTERRRRGFLWWLLPLLLLLGAGGWWLSRSPSVQSAVTGNAASRSLTVTTPAGATLPAEDFVMGGTGPAGDTLTIGEGDQPAATTRVGPDGTWQAAIPAPAPGEHIYRITGKDSGAQTEFKVTVGQGTGPANGSQTTGSGEAEGAAAGEGDTAGTAIPGTFAITAPAQGASLPAGGFELKGTGKPGDSLQVLEDGTSLGSVTVAGDGTWSLTVPSPAAGKHTYSAQAESGQALGEIDLTFASAQAGSGQNCDEAFTLSMTDGQTVNQPFRFGGVGGGKGYSVTVRRGERVVGTKQIPLDATCGWSYQSRPGPGQVTYEVRPAGEPSGEALSMVTLTVRP